MAPDPARLPRETASSLRRCLCDPRAVIKVIERYHTKAPREARLFHWLAHDGERHPPGPDGRRPIRENFAVVPFGMQQELAWMEIAAEMQLEPLARCPAENARGALAVAEILAAESRSPPYVFVPPGHREIAAVLANAARWPAHLNAAAVELLKRVADPELVEYMAGDPESWTAWASDTTPPW